MSENTFRATDEAPAPAPVASSQRILVSQWSTTRLKRTLRIVNLFNGLLLIIQGFVSCLTDLASLSFDLVTVSIYVVFFGLMLSCLECNVSGLTPRFQKNFGFMFSFFGRTLFIIFCGSMSFAVANLLGYLIGSFTLLNGFFNGYVMCVHPAFKNGELSISSDPYGGYSGGEKEMMAYLRTKPQLAAQASKSALMFAQNHPDAAQAVFTAAVTAPSNTANQTKPTFEG